VCVCVCVLAGWVVKMGWDECVCVCVCVLAGWVVATYNMNC